MMGNRDLAITDCVYATGSPLVAQTGKNLPAMREPKGMATHSSIRAWEIPWTEEPGRLQSVGLWKSQT